MKRSSLFMPIMALGLALAVGGTSAEAALQAVGPVDPATTLPAWYQDTGSLALTLCIDQTPLTPGAGGPCVLPPNFDPDPAVANLRTPPNAPVTTITATGPINDNNFPDESFYWLADSDVLNIGTGTGRARFRMALEAAFLAGVSPNQGIVFLRINLGIMSGLVPNAVYTVTYPFGTFTVVADANGVTPVFRQEDPVGPTPGVYDALLPGTNTNIGPFLVWDPTVLPAAPAGFIGDPAVPHPLINPATPLTQANFRIDGPNIGGQGVNTISTNLFTLAGKKIGLDVNPPANAPTLTAIIGDSALVHTPVTVKNITSGPISFPAAPNALPITSAGGHAADFTVINDTCSGVTLAANASCSFEVQFLPASGAFNNHAVRDAEVKVVPNEVALAPPVTIKLNGIAQHRVNMATVTTTTATGVRVPGAVTPAQSFTVNAGGSQTFTFVPETGFIPRVLVDGSLVAVASDNTLTLGAISTTKTVNVKFLRAGDMNENGLVQVDDALKALRVAVGIDTPTDDQRVAADVGPLASSKPKGDGNLTAGDVLLILRRAVGLDPNW